MNKLLVKQAIVVAGGRGNRFGCCGPKSLIKVEGSPLIVQTVESLLRTKVREILVFVDREEFLPLVKVSISHLPGVQVLKSRVCDSTFLVVKDAVNLLHDRFFFVYGHAPRPDIHLKQMTRVNARLIATVTKESTKRKTIMDHQGMYLEPPYLLDRALVDGVQVQEWAEFFDIHHRMLTTVELKGPPEFNYPHEFDYYRQYVIAECQSAIIGERVNDSPYQPYPSKNLVLQ